LSKRINKKKVETPWSNIGDVLPSVLGSIVKMKKARPKNIDHIWRAVIDPRFANYTKPERIRGDTLYIKVSSGAIFSELAMIGTDEILEKLKQRGAFSNIKRIVYRR
jgi:predicted nucleic acid-binding Zn ribbon protein